MWYETPEIEATALRRAVARARCRVDVLEISGGLVRGALACPDGWSAARLLLALAIEDSRTRGAQLLARELRTFFPSDEAFARALQTYVRDRVAFVRETGEVFQSGWFTLEQGSGDCDDHARLVIALALAGGLPARLALLHRGRGSGPTHAVAVLCPGGVCRWAETTIPAYYGEHPNAAARRLGITNVRSDIAKEVYVMSENELAPIPPGFIERNDPATVAHDAEALFQLGYLGEASRATSDPTDPALRQAVYAFQIASGLHADGLLGDLETRPAIARAIGDVSAAAIVPRASAYISDRFLRDVVAMASRNQASGARADALDYLGVWLYESGLRSSTPNHEGQPYGGLNQMGPVERTAVGFVGSFKDWLSLTLTEQLPFVDRYYRQKTGGNVALLADAPAVYLATIAPAFMAHANEPGFALYARDPNGPAANATEAEWSAWKATHRSDAYAFNRNLDTARKGFVAVADLQGAIDQGIKMAPQLWSEVQARVAALGPEPPTSVAGKAVAAVGVALALATGAWATWWAVKS